MNEQLIRTSLAKAGSGKTDWSRLAEISDLELEAAIANDTDTFALEDSDLRAVRRKAKASEQARFAIMRGKDGRFRWCLVAPDGSVLAAGYSGTKTKAQAKAEMLVVRMAMISANLSAA